MALSNISVNSAAYKRWQQKANALAHDDPQKYRILMSLADDEFAGEQMRKRILNLSRTTAREGRERTLDLATRKHESNVAFQKRTTDIAKDALKTSKTLGYLNLPLSGAFGYMKYKRDVSEAQDIRDLRESLFGRRDDSGSTRSFEPNTSLSQDEITNINPKKNKPRSLFRPY